MIVVKRINNNVVLANDNGRRMIVTGKGVGFQVYPNDPINELFIEKRYLLQEDINSDYYIQLLKKIPLVYLDIAQKIFKLSEENLNSILPINLIFTLADHLCFSVKRFNEGIPMNYLLDCEIKQFYPKEYEIGCQSIQLLKNEINLDIPNEECVGIAMHLVNYTGGLSKKYNVNELTETMLVIIMKIEEYLNIKINRESAIFSRFITHLRYYIVRQLNMEIDNSIHEDLVSIVKEKYLESYKCAEYITCLVDDRYNYRTNDSEKLYLALHINRLLCEKKE